MMERVSSYREAMALTSCTIDNFPLLFLVNYPGELQIIPLFFSVFWSNDAKFV